METAAGVAAAAARGVSLPMNSSQASRKEWRVVSEQSVRNPSNEELERSRSGLSDERLIYEVQQGREPADVDFCTVTIDGNLDNDILAQRLHSLVKQREELQQMEISVRAKLIARAEMMEMQNAYDSQLKDHTSANVQLQEQLLEKEQMILELERKMEEKERELHATRLDNEAAWAKEDLLREQSKELQTYRRERENSEAERAQHIQQIHDLQEHIQDKERQFMELQEQNRIAQEAILFKDEQLREAQAWVTRVQERDALQSTTNHSLQAELQDRTEQYNQLWLACQRQFAEMERLYVLIQQLQLELADAREKSGTYSDGSRGSQTNSKDHSQIGEINGSELAKGGSSTPHSSSHLPNANSDVASFISMGTAPRQTEHVHGLPIAPTSFVGMPTYLPPGQMAALHPFVMHQQGVPHSVPSHVGQFHSVPALSSLQHWQNQQAAAEGKEQTIHDQHPSLNTEAALLGSDSGYEYESSVNGQVLRPEYLNINVSQGIEHRSVVPSSDVEGKVEKGYSSGGQAQAGLQEISSQFHGTLRLDSLENSNSIQENVNKLEGHSLMEDKPGSTSNLASYDDANHLASYNGNSMKTSDVVYEDSMKTSDVVPSEPLASSGPKGSTLVGKPVEMPLLDERALLACIVRTIPPGPNAKIRISSTLPNRLGKMIAPLHWHDYKRKYGKLDEFVASHPELFVIEGDYIHLREGAQEIIAATAAVAKVAAAAAATSYSPLLSSVAVTPVAQSHRLKKAPSVESSSGKSDSSMLKEYGVSRPPNASDNYMHISAGPNQAANGVPFTGAGGLPNVKILSKPKNMEMNGFDSRSKHAVLLAAGNGANSEKNDFGGSQNIGSTHWRAPVNAAGQQLSRSNGAGAS